MLEALLSRPTSVLVGAAALVTLGALSLLRLPVSLLPLMERPKLVVVATDQDRSRQSLRQEVVEPLERSLLSIPGVLGVASQIDDGVARVELTTEWQTDPDRLRIDAARRQSEIAGLDLDTLSISVETGDRSPILEVAVRGGRSVHERTSWAEHVLRPELVRLHGAGRVERWGGALEHAVVRPWAPALAARGLSAEDVALRLSRVGQTQPLGRARDGGVIRRVVLNERISSVEELRTLDIEPSRSSNGEAAVGKGVERARRSTPLGDVAGVAVEAVRDAGLFRLDGQDAVLVRLHRAPEANAVALARAAHQALRQLLERAPPGLEAMVVYDASQEVVGTIRLLGWSAVLGMLLGTLVLRLLLGHWGSTLVMSLVVPSSVLAAFGAFLVWNVALDVVSLAGLALALGMLVDNAIVVLESIHRQPSASDSRCSGERSEEHNRLAVGLRAIAAPLLAAFLTTAAVFVPLLYLRGLARAFFGVQAFAIVTSLALSLLFSLTVAPVLARLLGSASWQRGRQPARHVYLAVLSMISRSPGLNASLFLLLCASAGGVALTLLDRELVPPGSSLTVRVPFDLDLGLDYDRQRAEVASLEEKLQSTLAASELELERLQVRYREWRLDDPSRQSAAPTGPARNGLAMLRFEAGTLPDEADLARLRRALSLLPGIDVDVEREHAAFTRALQQAKGRWQIEVSAATPARVDAFAASVISELRRAGLRPRDRTESRRRSVVDIAWDRPRLARLGLSELEAERQTSAALGERYHGLLDHSGLEPEILLAQTEPRDIRLVPIAAPPGAAQGGMALPINALAAVTEGRRELDWLRRDGRFAHLLELETDTSIRLAELSALLGGLPLADDQRLVIAGDAYELQRAFTQLRLALALAVLLVFLSLGALYESLVLPLAVMATAPVAAAGSLLLLLVSGQSLNVISFLGLILLVGIVINNSIVLLHRLEQHRQAGLDFDRALSMAATERYRPILMTTLTTVLGMAPLAILGGEGAELRRALAIAICGGLISGLLASLLLVPCLYRALQGGSKAIESPSA